MGGEGGLDALGGTLNHDGTNALSTECLGNCPDLSHIAWMRQRRPGSHVKGYFTLFPPDILEELQTANYYLLSLKVTLLLSTDGVCFISCSSPKVERVSFLHAYILSGTLGD